MKECYKCGEMRQLDYFYKDKSKSGGRSSRCKICERTHRSEQRKKFPEKEKIHNKLKEAIRRSREKALPSEFNGKQWSEVISRFGGKCAISDSKNFVLEHFVPLAWGHGGTNINNCIPMDADLNSSKGTKNVFEWIQEPDVSAKIDFDLFESLIGYLAIMNDMSVDEYKDFVYWCEANKRTIEEVNAANKTSRELWEEFSSEASQIESSRPQVFS